MTDPTTPHPSHDGPPAYQAPPAPPPYIPPPAPVDMSPVLAALAQMEALEFTLNPLASLHPNPPPETPQLFTLALQH